MIAHRKIRIKIFIAAGIALALPSACVTSPDDPQTYDALFDYQKARHGLRVYFQTLPQYDPNRLIGRTRDSVIEDWGPPDFVRIDGGTEFWQYRAQDCIIDMFLSADEGGEAHVSHIDLRGRQIKRQMSKAVLRQCLYLMAQQNIDKGD